MTSLAALGAFPALGGPVANTLDQTPQIRQRTPRAAPNASTRKPPAASLPRRYVEAGCLTEEAQSWPGFTTSTEQGASRRVRSATLPSTRCLIPV